MIQFRVPMETMEALEALAVRNRVDRSEIARQMISACVALNPISEEERAYARSLLTGKTERSTKLSLVLPEPVKTCTFAGLQAPDPAALAAAVEPSGVRPRRPNGRKSEPPSPPTLAGPVASTLHSATG